MKKICLISVLALASIFSANAQVHVSKEGKVSSKQLDKILDTTYPVGNTGFRFDPKKVVIGGSFGMQFGDESLVNIAPQVGYTFSKYFTAGTGVGYTYQKNKFYSDGEKYKSTSHYASVNVFGRFYPIQHVVLSVQPEANYMWRNVKAGGINHGKYKDDKFVPSVLVGGGFRYGGLTAMIQYDVVQDDYSPYSDNIFYSVGYMFSF